MEAETMQIETGAYVTELETELQGAVLEVIKTRALVRTMLKAALLEESLRQTDESGELVDPEEVDV